MRPCWMRLMNKENIFGIVIANIEFNQSDFLNV
jgi:hypothetical protein